MDFSILYAMQTLRSPVLDALVLGLTTVMGSYGQIWPVLGVVLCLFPKTRRCGAAMLLSYALVFVVGQYGLKDWIARPRPCHLDQSVELLVTAPASYSFPSTHTAWAFAAATSVLLYFRKPGVVLMVVAALIGLSRMYLFVHFPTDVLFGAVLGAALAALAVWVVGKLSTLLSSRQARQHTP
ncbi:MAG: phosphatase PAP2 family protein [Aristaeellaceae bacterium]